MLSVRVVLNEYLVAVFQSAASTNPTTFEYRLSLKDEVHERDTHKNEVRKQNFIHGISAGSNPKLEQSNMPYGPVSNWFVI